MIFLSGYNKLKTLDDTGILELTAMIGMVRPPKYHREFCEKPDNDFYGLFYDLLIDQSVPCAFELDWKWDPDDVFKHFERFFQEIDIKPINIWEDSDYQLYDIEYSVGDKSYTANVEDNQPSHLLSDIEKRLDDKQFIYINFGEDSYAYLIVSQDFDVERLIDITGLEPAKREITALPQPRYDIRHPNLKKDFKQPEKIFFVPTIICVEDSHTASRVLYRQTSSSNGESRASSQVWAGRILAGQAAYDGIAAELKEELDYAGRFDYTFAGYDGTFKDKKGKDVHRYSLGIFLYDKPFPGYTKGGYAIELQKMTGFDINLFKAAFY